MQREFVGGNSLIWKPEDPTKDQKNPVSFNTRFNTQIFILLFLFTISGKHFLLTKTPTTVWQRLLVKPERFVKPALRHCVLGYYICATIFWNKLATYQLRFFENEELSSWPICKKIYTNLAKWKEITQIPKFPEKSTIRRALNNQHWSGWPKKCAKIYLFHNRWQQPTRCGPTPTMCRRDKVRNPQCAGTTRCVRSV